MAAKFRNLATGDVFFEAPAPTDKSQPDSPSSTTPTTLASIPRNQLFHYEFGVSFFRLSCFGISLKLQSGEQELSHVRLVENYFFRNERIKSFQFTYGRLAPNTVTTWDLVYDMPPHFASLGARAQRQTQTARLRSPLAEARVRESPDDRIFADTFLFNNETLLQHNKVVISFVV